MSQLDLLYLKSKTKATHTIGVANHWRPYLDTAGRRHKIRRDDYDVDCGCVCTMEIEIYVQHEIEVLHETFNNKL